MSPPKKCQFATLIALVLILLATSCTSTSLHTPSSALSADCPADCQCVVIKGVRLHNHAKCSSVNGLLPESHHDTQAGVATSSMPIHSLDLSHLGLRRISHHLEKLRDLTSIDLSHNELSEIGHLGRRVKTLNLRHNRITSGKLTKIPHHVQHLDLSHNELTYLPLELTKLASLQSIELSHNQINCSCDTLEVRNWLQEKHVFTESHIKCTYPAEVKDKSWLQIKQSAVCEREKRKLEGNEDENELMLGDQPLAEGSSEHDEDEEELGKDYMPVSGKAVRSTSNENVSTDSSSDIEGSGDLGLQNMEYQMTDVPNTSNAGMTDANNISAVYEDEDGSGSGMGILSIPKMTFDTVNDNDDDVSDDGEQSVDEASPSENIFGNGLGIVKFHDTEEKPFENKSDEDAIVTAVHHDNQASISTDDTDPAEAEVSDTGAELAAGEDVEKASILVEKDESKATYYLLGIILLVVMGLILFVGFKRCKSQTRQSHDAENPRCTELLDMDKKNPGKPVHRNGNEHAPLIGEKKKDDMAKPISNSNGKRPSYDVGDIKDGQTKEPLLNGDSAALPESGHNESNNNNIPASADIPKISEPIQVPEHYDPNHRIIPRYPPPKSPRASKYAQHAGSGDESAVLPSSPRSGRYSPVYSPETGRVKIKLTETPKPKTPMLVTRSKSNAGDFVTTPVNSDIQDLPEVHQPGQGVTATTQQ